MIRSSCFLLASPALARNNLSRVPPMGWMSWEIFRCNVDCAKVRRRRSLRGDVLAACPAMLLLTAQALFAAGPKQLHQREAVPPAGGRHRLPGTTRRAFLCLRSHA